jgi:ABC-2 type transport system permease protein
MFAIFKGHQKNLLRDKGSIFFIAIFPTLLVFILGTMLANLDNPDATIGSMEIAYHVDSEDPEIVATVDAIVEEFEAIEQPNFTPVTNLDQAKEQLERGEITSLVVFREPFAIDIYEGMDSVENKAVCSIFTSVSRIHSCISTVRTHAIVDLLAAAEAAATGATAPNAAALNAANALATLESTDIYDTARVEEKDFGISRTMMDYYAITMIVMMFFMGSFFSGAMSFYEARKDGTLRRVLASPLNRASVFLQYMASQLPLNLIQILVVMFVSTTFFGAHYAATWQLNVLLFVMLLVTGMACSSLALILGIFIKINPGILLMPVIWPILFLCGTFSKEINIPSVSPFLPPSLIQQAAFDLTLFGETTRSLWVLAVSAVLIVIAALIGSALFRKKEVVS